MCPSDIPTGAQEHLSGHDIWLTSTLYTQRKKKTALNLFSLFVVL